MSNSIKTKQILKYTLGSWIPNDILIIIMIIITMDLPVCKKICPNNATQFRHWDTFVETLSKKRCLSRVNVKF